ncbi:MAG: hypothetical protein GWP09_01915 [Nitrospiraceae bacterium]|nr:hypothetical protein [Nitrospiraceae bacterium]
MELKEPQSMEELYYYTNRDLENNGEVRCWVFKRECPQCHKALLEKPKGKNGKIKIRAKEFVCPNCGFVMGKEEYEKDLIANIEYTCPHCGYHGKTQIPFKRKKVKGVEAMVFTCEKCGEKIYITKKMKEIKKK